MDKEPRRIVQDLFVPDHIGVFVIIVDSSAPDDGYRRQPLVGWLMRSDDLAADGSYMRGIPVATPVLPESLGSFSQMCLEFPEGSSPRWVEPEIMSYDTLDEALEEMRGEYAKVEAAAREQAQKRIAEQKKVGAGS